MTKFYGSDPIDPLEDDHPCLRENHTFVPVQKRLPTTDGRELVAECRRCGRHQYEPIKKETP